MIRLQNGELFPSLEIPAVGGGTILIPRSLRGSYGVVLIYRGAWCPYCQAQLGGFQRAGERLAEAGIKVVALSVDDEATTTRTIEKYKLRFPLGHSANADQIAALTGAYTNDAPRYLQSTGFLLGPDGRVLNAVYSSGPIGRLVAEDVIGMVTYLKSKA
ncbi:MAG: peroxiredoxin family protein [Steroidobacteraceae bacterium]